MVERVMCPAVQCTTALNTQVHKRFDASTSHMHMLLLVDREDLLCHRHCHMDSGRNATLIIYLPSDAWCTLRVPTAQASP